MPSKSLILVVLTVLLAYLWQVFLHDFVFFTLGVGRTYNRIEDFPYTCRRLQHPLLEGCEDIVLDGDGRTLYAACSTSLGRIGWSPGGNRFNLSARGLTDHVSVLRIDEPAEDGLYGLHQLEVSKEYKSSTGDTTIDVHGFKIEPIATGGLGFWMINHRPPVDEFGQSLDPKQVGANSTIEVFHLDEGSSVLQHVKTLYSNTISTPNNLAPTGDGGILFTNDHHDDKTSAWREVSFIFGSGSVGHCKSNGECKIAYPKGSFPNGVVKGHDGLYYVSQTTSSRITVLSLQDDGTLLKVDEIVVGMGVDNLSIDDNGDIFGAAFPKPMEVMKSFADPVVHSSCASTVFRIRRTINTEGIPEHEVTKVLEDIEAKVLPCSTVAVHDAKTGNFFLGSVTSPFITVCEKIPG